MTIERHTDADAINCRTRTSRQRFLDLQRVADCRHRRHTAMHTLRVLGGQ